MKPAPALLAASLLTIGSAAFSYEGNSSDAAFFAELQGIKDSVKAPAAELSLRKQNEPKPFDLPAYEVVRQGDAYFIFGPGAATRGGALKGPHLQFGLRRKVGKEFSVGVLYLNEGHADGDGQHNHRDGFAAMGWYDKPISGKAEVQMGVGPYFSMNTTPIAGRERDDKRLGMLAALALVYRLNDSGLGVRAQYNYVKTPATFDTKTFMIGLSQELGGAGSSSGAEDLSGAAVSFWTGPAVTNRSGQESQTALQIEVERPVDKAMHYTVSFIKEGNSGLTDRTGVAAQAWYVAPTEGGWTFSAGAGPYVAREAIPADKGAKLLGVISFGAERRLGKGLALAFRFSRVVSSYNKDEDLFLIGVRKVLR